MRRARAETPKCQRPALHGQFLAYRAGFHPPPGNSARLPAPRVVVPRLFRCGFAAKSRRDLLIFLLRTAPQETKNRRRTQHSPPVWPYYVFFGDAEGDAEGDTDGEGDAAGDTLAEGDTDGDTDGEGERLGETTGDAAGDAEGFTETVGAGECVMDGLGDVVVAGLHDASVRSIMETAKAKAIFCFMFDLLLFRA